MPNGTKKCSGCGEIKKLEYFYNQKSSKDGKQTKCKECKKQKDSEYYKLNKDRILNYQKNYYKYNTQEVKNYQTEYRKNNTDKISNYHKKYYQDNKEELRIYKRIYKKQNRNRILEYIKNKYNEDIEYKLRSLLRGRINSAIKKISKRGSAVKDLGCSIEFFKKYLESKFTPDMNWDNYGSMWHLDHIIPLAAFDLTDRFQFRAACYYENLQPLSINENLQKGCVYDQKSFIDYLNYFKNIMKGKNNGKI